MLKFSDKTKIFVQIKFLELYFNYFEKIAVVSWMIGAVGLGIFR